MSNLSDLLPAGASGKTIEAVATATIASKAPVILNSAGTVSPISETSVSEDLTLGSIAEWSSTEVSNMDVAFDSGADKVLIVYRDNDTSNYLGTIVGTVNTSTGAVTWGTKTILNSANSQFPKVVEDPNATGKFVVTFSSGHTQSKVALISVTGTTPTYAGEVNIGSGTKYFQLAADPNTSQSFVAGAPDDTTKVVYCVGFTYSGTTFTIGSQTSMGSTTCNDGKKFSIAFDQITAGKFACAYRQYASPYYGYFIAGSISTGTTVNAGTEEVFRSAATDQVKCAFDGTTADKFITTYYTVSGNIMGATVATISGTDATWGTEVTDTAPYTPQENYGSKLMPVYGTGNNYYLSNPINGSTTNVYLVRITTSGTVPTWATWTAVGDKNHSGDQGSCGMSRYSTGAMFSAWLENTTDDGDGRFSQGAYTSTNLTSTNFVGIADAGISTSATGTIVVQGGTVTGMSSLTTGGKYYVQNDGTLTSPNATEAYSINGATYDSVSFDVTQDGTITGMCFNGDGTKMYVCGEGTDTVYQYSLSSAYDLSTASYDSVSLSVASQQGAPRSVVFNNDGSALYICGPSSSSAHQYTLSTPYDLSTGSYASKTINLSSQELYPCGLIFNNDGSSMYVVGSQNETVYQYTLSTPFDLSTASYASKSLDGSSEQSSSTGLAFNSDGTKIFIIGETPTKIFQYTLSSAYDASTGSYDSISYTYSEGSVPRDIVWGNSGNKFYIPDSGPDDIYQYTPGGGASSSVNAGLAISTTALLLNGDS